MVVDSQTLTIYSDNYAILTFALPSGETFDPAGGDVAKFSIARISGGGPLRQDPVFEKAASLTLVAVDPGVATVEILSTDLPGVEFAPAGDVTYHFQVEHTDSSNRPVVIAEGTIKVKVNVEETI